MTKDEQDRERRRLAALERLAIVNTPAEEEFDNLVRLAALLCGTPIALINIIDAQSQWTKASFGVDAPPTPREQAICNHTIAHDDPMVVVDDLAEDTRFCHLLAVQGAPSLRFYAGATLYAEAQVPVGAICVLDVVPRELTEAQTHGLGLIAKQVDLLMERRVERRLAAAVHNERDRFLEQSIDIFCVATLEGHFTRVNPAMSRILGYSAQELLTIPFLDLVHPDDVAPTAAEVIRLSHGETTIDFENRYRTKSGAYVTLSWRATFDALTRQIYCVGRDITAAMAQEVTLRSAQLTLRRVFELSPTAKILVDDNQRIRLANDAAHELFGYPSGALIGLDIEVMVPPRYRKGHLAMVLEYMKKPQARIMGRNREVHGYRPDGTTTPIEISLRAIELEEETTVLVVATDISERKRVEREIRAAQLAAERANQSKSVFLANMSHEIRTPMNAVIGLTYLALRTQLTAQQHDYLRKISASAKGLLRIINDILDISKIEAGKLEMQAEPFDLSEWIEVLTTVVAVQAQRKSLELVVDVRGGLPRDVVGDQIRLNQVMINLCSNAIKFTDRGEVVVTIGGEHRDDQIWLTVSVRDTGIGMEAEDLIGLFEPFRQLDASTSRRFDGTGLGLSITKNLIELMGGTVRVQSTPGVGSEFSFAVPLQRCAGQAVTAKPHPIPGMSGRRVLVIDDNSAARGVTARLLRGWRLDVEVAADGREAIEVFSAACRRHETPDMILIDWRMPDMDGIEVAKRLADHPGWSSRSRVIMMTDLPRSELEAHVAGLALCGIVTKPINPSTLLDLFIACDEADVVKTWQTPDTESAYSAVLSGATVLLVEDNALNQQVATELLRNVGIRVLSAHNGQEALDRAAPGLDAILMDVHMPVMDGLTATARLSARPELQHIPVIAMTANAMPSDRAAVADAGMVDFIAKPIDPEAMYATLAKWVDYAQRQVVFEVDTDTHNVVSSQGDGGAAGKPRLPRASTRRASTNRAASRRVSAATTTARDVPSRTVHARQRRGVTSSPAGLPSQRLPDQAATDHPQAATIDLVAARRRFAGNDALLARLLTQFCEEHASTARDIERMLAADELQEAVDAAHAIKGVAGNLGVSAVAERAAAIEAALTAGRPVADELSALGSAVRAAVRAIEGDARAAEPGVAAGLRRARQRDSMAVAAARQSSTATAEELLAYLQRLSVAIDSHDFEALELSSWLLNHHDPGPARDRLVALHARLERFDFFGAREVLDQG